jgi:hypothetical protein
MEIQGFGSLAERTAPIWAGLLCVVVSFWIGVASLGKIVPGGPAERESFREAPLIARGDHSYGIVAYTHYPNGPVYILAAMIALGMSVDEMRMVPIGFAAVSLGFLVWAMVSSATSWTLRAWALFAGVVISVQPGVALWQGALHEHSYALSLALLGIGMSVAVTPGRTWLFWGLGFIAGWIGYDFLPSQVGAIFTAR